MGRQQWPPATQRLFKPKDVYGPFGPDEIDGAWRDIECSEVGAACLDQVREVLSSCTVNELVEVGLVDIDGDHAGVERLRQHERLPSRAAAEVQNDGLGWERGQATKSFARGGIGSGALPRQVLMQNCRGVLRH